MAAAFKFELVSPERILMSEDIVEVLLPGTEGDYTVLAGHAPDMSILRPGVLKIKTAAGKDERILVYGGLAEKSGEQLTVLAQRAVNTEGVDAAWIDAQKADARSALDAAKSDDDKRLAQTLVDELDTLRAA
ncbi:MAG: F0F1 ATP synthase subunit epsilon [Pseudomonadota bacterium]